MTLEMLESKWMVIYKSLHILESNQFCCKVSSMTQLIWRKLTVQVLMILSLAVSFG